MKAGVFNLTAVAIAGMNQTDEHYYNLTLVQGSIWVTVVAPTGGTSAGSISGGFLTIILGRTVAAPTILIISIR